MKNPRRKASAPANDQKIRRPNRRRARKPAHSVSLRSPSHRKKLWHGGRTALWQGEGFNKAEATDDRHVPPRNQKRNSAGHRLVTAPRAERDPYMARSGAIVCGKRQDRSRRAGGERRTRLARSRQREGRQHQDGDQEGDGEARRRMRLAPDRPEAGNFRPGSGAKPGRGALDAHSICSPGERRP